MAYQLTAVTVLIVEDNQPMMEITKSLLKTFGIGRVVTAKNGEEGLRAVKKYDPDIIIADWMMKPIDGISFTRQLRHQVDVPNPYVPVILMTGFSEKRRVLQARDSGVTEFLVKPFSARDLYKRIVQIIERPRQFVRTHEFFGPDRRRTSSIGYSGVLRREDDRARIELELQRLQAQEALNRMKEKSKMTVPNLSYNADDIDMIDRTQ